MPGLSLMINSPLRCPIWAMRNGAKRHIDAINKLLPGSILVIKDYFAGLSRDVTPTTRANYLICVKAAVKDYYAERYYTDYA